MIAFCALFGLMFVPTKPSRPDTPEVITAVEPHAVVVDDVCSWAKLEPTGREIFFPKPLHGDHGVYELTLQGVLRGDRGRADAFYRIDHDGNFTLGMDWVRVGHGHLKNLDYEFVEHERAMHRYTVRFAWVGQMTLALDNHRWWADPVAWHGALLAEVRLLPADTGTKRQRTELERKRVEEESKVAEAKAEAAAQAAEFARILKSITIRARTEANWRDPEFRDKFARVHGADLLRQQREIRNEATQFLEQHRLVAFLQRHEPDVIEIVLGRLKALEIAERRALDVALAPTATPQKKKLTAEQVRAIKIHRQEVEIGDRVALKLNRVETRLQIRERLEKMALDPDEREMLQQELISEIEEGDDDENARTI